MSHESGLPPVIPREVLFGNPEKIGAQISPDGKRWSYVAPYEGVLNVWVKTVGVDDARVVTKDRERGIRSYSWAYGGDRILYLQDQGGNENWRLYGCHLETGECRDYTPFEDVQVQMVKAHKDCPDQILIALNRDNPQLHDVYRLDLESGDLTLEARNPGAAMGWVADEQLNVRLAQTITADGGSELLHREPGSEEWTRLIRWEVEDSFSAGPIGFTRDGRSIYLRDTRGANAARLVLHDIESGREQVIAEDPTYDVGRVLFDPETQEVRAVAFERARQEWRILDPGIQADFDALRALHDGDFFLSDWDLEDRVWIVVYVVDDGPVAYFAYDRQAGKGTFLFHNRSELAAYRLASREPISYEARDGLTIHGYLTSPVGLPRESLPLVLVVHGGPYHRDTWTFDPEAQWLANRGYAVLQLNYRGSTGYGKEFLNAGNKEWGGKMHDDLVDGVRWAVEQGLADPERVAIYGGSYGGYASLVGVTFTPDLFRCAVAIVGPSNLVTFMRSFPPYWVAAKAIMYERLGNPDTEEEFLRSRSPLHKVDRIKAPLLIAHGANDPRVAQAESEQIVAAMRERGIEHEYLLFPDEGHGLAKPANRLKLYRATEAFLARHLGGRSEA